MDKKSIYIIHYPKNVNENKHVYCSFGILNEIKENKSEINYLCSTEKGSSGSPILSLDTREVIGLHKGTTKDYNYNIGVLMRDIIVELLNHINNKFPQKYNSSINDYLNSNLHFNYNKLEFINNNDYNNLKNLNNSKNYQLNNGNQNNIGNLKINNIEENNLNESKIYNNYIKNDYINDNYLKNQYYNKIPYNKSLNIKYNNIVNNEYIYNNGGINNYINKFNNQNYFDITLLSLQKNLAHKFIDQVVITPPKNNNICITVSSEIFIELILLTYKL